jgi:hypothetical protein
MYAVIEVKRSNGWVLGDDLVADLDYGGERVPQNIAPESWGKYNYRIYFEGSGERDFPADLSPPLRAFIDQYWSDANRPSWMTLKEMKQVEAADHHREFAHFDVQQFSRFCDRSDDAIRVIFWADQ